MFQDELSQALYWLLIDKKGIVDITDSDIKARLDAMTPEEARIVKRKFRKLWRKRAKVILPKHQANAAETRNGKPTHKARRIRAALVTSLINAEVVEKAFEITVKRR